MFYLIFTFILLIIFLFFSYKYFKHYYNNIINIIYLFFFFNILFCSYFLFYSNLNFFSKTILGLCIYINYIVLVSLNSKFKYFIFQTIFLYSFNIITYFLVYSNNILILFICYELLMIPSIILIISGSYSLRTFSSMLYFLIWTQTGSFLVLIVIIYLNNLISLDLLVYKSLLIFINPNIIKLLNLLLFFGFGIKIPIFPFYRWLVQIHVESPSGFSIFLSGFLVKTALFFYYKLSIYLPFNIQYLELLIIFGILNSSLKFWYQTDIKKVIAYATIQEMNIIFFILYFIDQKTIFIPIIFIISHGFLSSLMFFIVELIYRRFLTRNIYEIYNLWQFFPILSKFIFIKLLIFLGLPLFLKFYIEVLFYLFCFSFNLPIFFFFFIIINLIGSIGYARVWLSILFLPFINNNINKNRILLKVQDLSLHEILICLVLVLINSFLIIFFIL